MSQVFLMWDRERSIGKEVRIRIGFCVGIQGRMGIR
jgi:hypothetical protein